VFLTLILLWVPVTPEIFWRVSVSLFASQFSLIPVLCHLCGQTEAEDESQEEEEERE
jgi:hypothetical protein